MSDALLNLLDLMRVRGTAYIAKNLAAPWGVYIDEHPTLARFHFVVSGSTWISLPESAQPELLQKGDIAIIPEGRPHSYFDADKNRDSVVRNYPTPDGNSRLEQLDESSDETHLLCGYFEISDHTPPALLERLPELLIGRSSDKQISTKIDLIMDALSTELSAPSGSSNVTLNRMTEMLCVLTIHDWFEKNLSDDEGLSALADPKTKLVLDKIHSAPEEPWTIDALAKIFGQSRTAFTSQFKLATGVSPMSYVRHWRIKLARKMLEDTPLSIDEIAFKSGYSDTNAFNRAFKRETGTSPGAHRRSAAV